MKIIRRIVASVIVLGVAGLGAASAGPERPSDDRLALFLRVAPELLGNSTAEASACDTLWIAEAQSAETYRLGFTWHARIRCGSRKTVRELMGYVQFTEPDALRIEVLTRSDDSGVYSLWRRAERESRDVDISAALVRRRWPFIQYPPNDEDKARRRFEELRPALEAAVGNKLQIKIVVPAAHVPGVTKGESRFGWEATLVPLGNGDGAADKALSCRVSIDPVVGSVTNYLLLTRVPK